MIHHSTRFLKCALDLTHCLMHTHSVTFLVTAKLNTVLSGRVYNYKFMRQEYTTKTLHYPFDSKSGNQQRVDFHLDDNEWDGHSPQCSAYLVCRKTKAICTQIKTSAHSFHWNTQVNWQQCTRMSHCMTTWQASLCLSAPQLTASCEPSDNSWQKRKSMLPYDALVLFSDHSLYTASLERA